MSCATSTLKFTALLLNLLCCICGGLILSASAYGLTTFNSSDAVLVPSIIGIVIGSLLFLTTILGCVGALRESIRLTWIYATILLMLTVAQILTIIFLNVNFEKLADDTVSVAFKNQITDKEAMPAFEQKYACCGKTGPNNYIDTGLMIPASCYKHQNSTIAADLYEDGCVEKLAVAMEDGIHIEQISDWSLVGIETFTVIVSFLLAITLKNAERRKLYH